MPRFGDKIPFLLCRVSIEPQLVEPCATPSHLEGRCHRLEFRCQLRILTDLGPLDRDRVDVGTDDLVGPSTRVVMIELR